MVEYVTEADQLFTVDMNMKSPGGPLLAGQVTIYSCKYSVLCRSIVIDSMSRIAVYELLADADLQLKVHMARFLLHQICLIPIEEFSAEYVRPQVHCIASYGPLVNQSATCVSLAHETPPTALILNVPSGRTFSLLPQENSPSANVIPEITLQAPQSQVTLRGLVPHLGRYVFVIHFYQAAHPTFPVQVFVDGGRPWSGSFRASFCPHVLGCRDQVISGGQVEFDISEPEVAVTVKVPEGKSLTLSQVTLRGLVPHLGRYVFVIHFYQAAHPTFPVQVFVDGGRPWSGSFRASFCPHVLGCRDQVISGGQVEFDISEPEVAVTVKVPEGKSLTLVRVLVVPAENYDYQILNKKSVDKSFEFITNCGGNSFYIDPQTASRFCKNSARSLVAFYHNGALPCECDPAGAISHHCNPEGGQCPCRPNIIGRQCTRCATGHYGFPHCKKCNCGRRLCEEATGQCLCPPRTVRPQCEACELHSFSFHPLAGCEGCNCSRRGIIGAAAPDCDKDSGQCRLLGPVRKLRGNLSHGSFHDPGVSPPCVNPVTPQPRDGPREDTFA
ncbi:Hypothetical predicted protein [Marmota monax]|nr:Hypothetical predicted protein [Marmota monax]